MKPSNALALVVTSVLAIGCAAARAQDGPGNPPVGPQPQPQSQDQRPRPEVPPEVREAMRQAEEQMRDAQTHARDAKAAMEKMERDGYGPVHPEMIKAREALEDAHKQAEEARARLQQIAGESDGRRGGPDGRRLDEDRRREEMMQLDMAWRRAKAGEGGRAMPFQREAMGPPPSMEERLAQLERAVHEMREMFERHDVPPEMRERAEREMRERRGDMPTPGGQPGEDPRPRAFGGRGEGQGPGRGEGRSFGGGPGPDRPPEVIERPAIPRPPIAGGGAGDDVRAAALRNIAVTLGDELERSKNEQRAMAKQLADTQAALKKAQEELETLRAKK